MPKQTQSLTLILRLKDSKSSLLRLAPLRWVFLFFCWALSFSELDRFEFSSTERLISCFWSSSPIVRQEIVETVVLIICAVLLSLSSAQGSFWGGDGSDCRSVTEQEEEGNSTMGDEEGGREWKSVMEGRKLSPICGCKGFWLALVSWIDLTRRFIDHSGIFCSLEVEEPKEEDEDKVMSIFVSSRIMEGILHCL